MTIMPRLAQLCATILILAGCHDARRSNLLDPEGSTPVSVEVNQNDSGAANVTWTRYAGEHPFAEYRVLRANARVQESRIDTLAELSDQWVTATSLQRARTLVTIDDPNLTSFVDTSLVPYLSYVYRVSVVTSQGLEVGSAPSRSVTGQAAQRISFYSDRDGNNEVYVMNPDGSGLTNLTNHGANDQGVGRPEWSPDASKILFVSQRDGNEDIWVMDADGGNQTSLTQDPGPDRVPRWSPDGTRIVFTSDRDGDSEIWVMDSDGGNLIQLTDIGAALSPAWSPDGTRMAFTSLGVIYVMDVDGTDQVRLIDREAEYDADFSPDGLRVAWHSFQAGGGLWSMNLDGTDLVNLTNGRVPDWSPDGSEIAFMSDRDGNTEIYVMNADGESPRNLTNHPADDNWPAWSPSVK